MNDNQVFLDVKLQVDSSYVESELKRLQKESRDIEIKWEVDAESGKQSMERLTASIKNSFGEVTREIYEANKELDTFTRITQEKPSSRNEFVQQWKDTVAEMNKAKEKLNELKKQNAGDKLGMKAELEIIEKKITGMRNSLNTKGGDNPNMDAKNLDVTLQKNIASLKEINKLNSQASRTATKRDGIAYEMEKTKAKLEEVVAKMKELNSEKNKSALKSSGLDLKADEVEKELDSLQAKLGSLKMNSPHLSSDFRDLKKEINSTGNSVDKLGRDLEGELGDKLTDTKLKAYNLAQAMMNYKRTNKDFLSTATKQDFDEQIRLLITQGETATEVANQIRMANQTFVDGKGESIGNQDKMGFFGKALQRFREFAPLSVSMSLTYKALNLFTQAMRESVKVVQEADKAMVELRKVTSGTEGTYKSFMKTAFNTGKELGRSGIEVINATADFARMGYSIEQSAGLAQQALLMLNVGDGIDNLEDATKSIVSTLKAYNVEAEKAIEWSRKINDVYNEVSNNFAIDTGDLAEGVRRSSAVLSISGNSFEETVAMLTGANEIIQNMEKSSTGLNTIAQRIQRISMDAKTGNLTAKMQETFDIAGVNLLDYEGNLRSTFDILTDLSKGWDNLTSKQKAYLTEQISGVRQSSVLSSLLTNFEQAEKALDSALNSQGSAMIENMKYIESMEGQGKRLTATFESIATSLPINILLSGLMGVAQVLADITDTLFNLDMWSKRKADKRVAEIQGSLDKAVVGTRLSDKFTNLVSKGSGSLSDNEMQELKNTVTDLLDVYPELNSVLNDSSLSYEQMSLMIKEVVRNNSILADQERDSFFDGNKDKISEYYDTIKEYDKKRSELQSEYRKVLSAGEEKAFTNMGGEWVTQAEYYEKTIEGFTTDIDNLNELIRTLSDPDVFSDLAQDANKMAEEFDNATLKTQSLSGDINALVALGMRGSSGDLEATDMFKELVNVMELTDEQIGNLKNDFPELMESFSGTENIEKVTESLNKLNSSFKSLQSALDEYNEKGYISFDTYLSLLEKYPDINEFLVLDGDKIKLTTSFVDKIANERASLLEGIEKSIDGNNRESESIDNVTESLKEVNTASEELQGKIQGGIVSVDKESVESVDSYTTKLQDLKKQFSDSKITGSEYFKSLNKGFNDLNKSKLSPEIKEELKAEYIATASKALVKLKNDYQSGKINAKEFSDAISSMNGFLSTNAELLKNTGDKSESTMKHIEDLSSLGKEIDNNSEKLEGYIALQKVIDDNADIFSKYNFNGGLGLHASQMNITEIKNFQREFAKVMQQIKSTSKIEWDSIVEDVFNATGKSKKKTEEELLDVNSNLYKDNVNFNKMVNTSVKKTETSIKGLSSSVIEAIKAIENALNGMNISTTVSTTQNADGSYTVGVNGSKARATIRQAPTVNGVKVPTGNSPLASQPFSALMSATKQTTTERRGFVTAPKKEQQPQTSDTRKAEKNEEILKQNSYQGYSEESKAVTELADRYAKYNAMVTQNNSLMEKNKRIMEDSNLTYREQANAIQKEVELKRRQQEILYMTNQERRAERDELKKLLSTQGFEFSGSGDNQIITNLNNINGQTKEVEEKFNRWIALQMSEIPKASEEWWELERAIKGTANAIETQISQLDMYIKSISIEKSNLETVMGLADLNIEKAKDLNELSKGGNIGDIVQAESQKLQAMADISSLMLEENEALNKQFKIQHEELLKLKEVLYEFGATFNGDLLSNLEVLSKRSDYGMIKGLIDNYTKLSTDVLPNLNQQVNKNTLEMQRNAYEMEKVVKASRELAQQKEMERLNAELEVYRQGISDLGEMQDKLIAIIRKRGEEERKMMDENHKRENDQFKEQFDMKVKGYKDELDEFNKMIKGKIDALDELYAKEDFDKQLLKEEEKANEIMRQIDIKRLDDSLTARTQVQKLEQDLIAQTEKISDLKEKRERTLRKDNLNAQLKDKESNTNAKIDLETKYYNDAIEQMKRYQDAEKQSLEERYSHESMVIEARKALMDGYVLSFDGNMKDLATAFMDFENKFGNGLGILGEKIQFDLTNKLQSAYQAMMDIANVGIPAMMRANYQLNEVAPIDWTDPSANISYNQNPSGVGGNNPLNMSDSDYKTYMANKYAYEDMERKGMLDHAQLNQWSSQNEAIRRKYGMSGDQYDYATLKQMEQNMPYTGTSSSVLLGLTSQNSYNPYSSSVTAGGTQRPATPWQPFQYQPEPYIGSGYNGGSSASRDNKLQSMINSMLAQQGDIYSKARRTQDGYADCSSAVWKAVTDSGLYPKDSKVFSTGDMISGLTQHDFWDMGKVKFEDLQYGDILVRPGLNDGLRPGLNGGHTEIYMGDGKTFGALGEGRGVNYRSSGWKNYTNVLRLKGYADGGKVDYTGLAMVHGSPTEPEWVFNNEQFQALGKVIASYQSAPIKLPQLPIGKSVAMQVQIGNLLNVEGNASKETIPQLQQASENILDVFTTQLKKNGMTIDFKG